MTREQAITLKPGDEVHAGRCSRTVGVRGGLHERIERWRVSGRVQLWKTRPYAFRLPMKHGLRVSNEINHTNAGFFHLASECPDLNPTQPADQGTTEDAMFQYAKGIVPIVEDDEEVQ